LKLFSKNIATGEKGATLIKENALGKSSLFQDVVFIGSRSEAGESLFTAKL
jgi:hypothetical protein